MDVGSQSVGNRIEARRHGTAQGSADRMKAATDVASELGKALDGLAAMHVLVSSRLNAQRGAYRR